ncbi:MAG: long-chain fatty acid--CoA ligase [Candidatus Velthaea sp.]
MASTLHDETTVRTLPGLMMDVPLTIRGILEHAVRNHARREIVSRDGPDIVRYTYADFGKRVAQLAHAVRRLGVGGGDRVASFGWNTHRHLELYYAVPCIGSILHTTNIRLFPEQVAEIIEHAGDKVVFVDGSLVPAMQKAIAARPALANLTYVIMGAATEKLPNAYDYETLLAAEPAEYRYPDLDENAGAILCYTSATTGDPKGALFSHRSTVIHAFAIALTDVFSISQRDVVLPIVPQFHVNAWGLPFLTLMVGAKMVMPGAALDPQSVCDLVQQENVTMSGGVPTVWLAARDLLKQTGRRIPSLNRIVIGGSAVPPALFDDLEEMGISVIHAWGMTEMSPVGTVSFVKGELAERPPEERRRKRLKQGQFSPIVQWRVVDEDGREIAQDGVSRGELYVRGPAVAREYFCNPAATNAAFVDGWFRTGDIVTVDEDGYMEIVDRSKDMIKSGGEWISSVELENTLMGHPSVKEACVFGVPHQKWMERPVAAVVLRESAPADEAAIRDWLATRVAKWWLPDRVVFVDAIPRTGVGKFLKRDLRREYAELLTS